ncbi:FGGY-family carbohydrate kinase [Saccharopolyspora hordei]|uniref:FGGY-family carbohydrate kinase n=1 Tax=Saccharopolyspora hordei TaxID=1838 RepID=UPI001C5439D6|nr:FGGY family carbohydrate kinase [Saccharopolyspora hordei]
MDVGSTNVKVVALDVTGRAVARVRRATPRPDDDPSIDADALLDLVEELVLEACGQRFAVAAISAAGVGEDGVLVDPAGRALTPALAWFDPRRAGVFRELRAELGSAGGIGVPTDPARTLVGWSWAMRQPGAERAASWVALTDFASSRWTGTRFLSDTLAARTAAWRTTTRSWVAERVRLTLGSPHLLPEVLPTGAVVGELRSERLRDVLTPGAVVVAGGHDHPVGGWGVDRLRPGAVLDSMGTAEVVVAQSPEPALDPGERIDTAPGIRHRGTTLLRVEELARNVQWAAQDPAVSEALQRIIAGDLQPDDHLFSTAFTPGGPGGGAPSYAPDAPAAPISRASAVLGALAALGGRAIRAVAAHSPGAPVYAAGGWARSRGWVEAKRAVTGTAVETIAEPEVTAVGAALLAASAIGWEVDPAAALAQHASLNTASSR